MAKFLKVILFLVLATAFCGSASDAFTVQTVDEMVIAAQVSLGEEGGESFLRLSVFLIKTAPFSLARSSRTFLAQRFRISAPKERRSKTLAFNRRKIAGVFLR